jgi:FtsP/CotA-like multicopper oxidase with cupredoxin domain
MTLVLALLFWGAGPVIAKDTPAGNGKGNVYGKMRSTTMAQRKAAAANNKAAGMQLGVGATPALAPVPGGTPDYFGPYPNYANSPVPMGPVGVITVLTSGSGYTAPVVDITDAYNPAAAGATASATFDPTTGAITGIAVTPGGSGTGYMAPVITITDPTGTGATAEAALDATSLVAGTGMRKFMDALPDLTVAVPDTTTYLGYDYYEIEAREYTQKMHSDLPPTRLRGYVQVKNGVDVAPISYLGPVILASRNKPVRVKFTNKLPTGTPGDLFIPVDTSYMGAGTGPNGGSELYTQNRASIHLHGGTTPWINDGTPHQWVTPATEVTSYPQGVSVSNVPDMPNPGPGSLTFFYTNQQSARLMFYHDHAYGITRLNVYAGVAAGYLLTDPVDMTLINGGTITYKDAAGNTQNVPVAPGTLPDLGIPLIIQDKTFVPSAVQLAAQDPTWNWGVLPTSEPNGTGNLWYPHVYMTNQNPWDVTGANAMGRWDYGPWFWPPLTNLQFGPIANPYYDPVNAPWEPPMIPGVPNISGTPEAFMDTPVINGMAYPVLTVDPKIYRFRILNAANDKYWNLSLWVADSAVTTGDGRTNTEVKMVPFNSSQNAISHFPSWWYTILTNFTFDDRTGGVPDPATRGPAMIQVGNEGGVLPGPAVIKNQPINYEYNRKNIVVGNVKEHALYMGPAERADILVDFSQFAGKTLILYNDAPSALPAPDSRLDYFTNDPDQVSTGGAPKTLAGFGPNTRTIMQIKVTGSGGTAPPDYVNPTSLASLKTALPAAFAATQDPIIVPQAAYNAVYGTSVVDTPGVNLAQIQSTSMTFTPLGQTTPVTFSLYPKAIQELFQMDYGRMNALLGVEIPNTNNINQTTIPQFFQDPPTELVKISDPTMTPIGMAPDGTQIWKITHNGVDTHAIHFHMFTVQIVNRVGWDGAISNPQPNELGFKDTVRMNPLEDIIVALRPIQLVNLPFKVPNSIRPLAPALPLHSTVGFTNVDPNGNPVTVSNELANFGWEYVWHCHLLGHEENDMMRAMPLTVAPEIPVTLTASLTGNGSNKGALINWIDNSANETSFTVQRATALTGPWVNLIVCATTNGPGFGGSESYTDPIGNTIQTYYYRVYASDTVGSTVPGYPQVTADSLPSNTAGVNLPTPPAAPTNLTATLLAGPQVRLNWTDNANNESGFVVERSPAAANTFVQVGGIVAANIVTFTDTTVLPGFSYDYRVKAINAVGSSAYSNVVTISTISPLPLAPSNVAVTAARVNGNNDRATVTWTDNSNNETGFRIQMATNSGFTTGLVTSTVGVNVKTFTTGNIKRATNYYFRVQSYNASGTSVYVNATPFPVLTP